MNFPAIFSIFAKLKQNYMTREELQEILALLDEAGVRYELCDTPVPVSLSGVPCGFPKDLNDECIDDYYLVPKSLVGPHPEMFVHAIGDSMLEAASSLSRPGTP